jgi:hypothetical protein
MAQRYGLRGRGPGRPAPPPPAAYVPPPLAPGPASRGGLQIALDEKLLKVTLMLEAVKPVTRK